MPAAFADPKLGLETMRQLLPWAVRNGMLKMLYISARNWRFQGPEPKGPLSANRVSLKNDQSKFVKLLILMLSRPQVPLPPIGG
jgi:hypothetical protein